MIADGHARQRRVAMTAMSVTAAICRSLDGEREAAEKEIDDARNYWVRDDRIAELLEAADDADDPTGTECRRVLREAAQYLSQFDAGADFVSGGAL